MWCMLNIINDYWLFPNLFFALVVHFSKKVILLACKMINHEYQIFVGKFTSPVITVNIRTCVFCPCLLSSFSQFYKYLTWRTARSASPKDFLRRRRWSFRTLSTVVILYEKNKTFFALFPTDSPKSNDDFDSLKTWSNVRDGGKPFTSSLNICT
jgi:hypothetical protein